MTTIKAKFPAKGKRYSATKNGALSDKQAQQVGIELEVAGFDEEPDPHDVLEYAKNNPETVLFSGMMILPQLSTESGKHAGLLGRFKWKSFCRVANLK
jgi:hypothetical protein